MGHNNHHHHHHDVQQEDMQDEVEQQQQEEDQEEEEAESMVLVPSDISGDSVNMMQEDQVVVQFMQHLDIPVIPHQRLEKVIAGPIIPPDMQWAKMFDHMIPKLLFASVPLSLQLSPFLQLKRSWENAFVFGKEEGWFISKGLCINAQHRSKYSPRRNEVIRKELLEDKKDDSEGFPMDFEATHLVTKKKIARKVITPLVQSNDRRFTRSCLKDGYSHAPVLEAPPKKKAKGRAKLLVVQVDAQHAGSSTPSSDTNNHTENEDGFIRTPATPIHVLQRVGRQLGIAEENLTKEKLEAAPKETKKDKSDNV
jgi:hypothetical protein